MAIRVAGKIGRVASSGARDTYIASKGLQKDINTSRARVASSGARDACIASKGL